MKKIHVWLENEEGKIYLIAWFDLKDSLVIPKGMLSERVKIEITYEEAEDLK